jgi:hypothetical protein
MNTRILGLLGVLYDYSNIISICLQNKELYPIGMTEIGLLYLDGFVECSSSDTNIYIYIYIYIHIYLYIFMHIYICKYMHIHKYIYVYVYT